MAFLVNDIFKRDIESCPERAKSFFIRDILSRPTASETADMVHGCVTSENGDANLLAVSSPTTSFMADCISPTLDRHQFHAVSLYVPSSTDRYHPHQHHHQQQQLPVSLTAAFQQPQTTFLLPNSNGNIAVFVLSLMPSAHVKQAII